MIQTIPAADLNDEQLRQDDEATQCWYLRILLLRNDTGCTLELAIKAVDTTDESAKASGILKERVVGA